MTFDVGTLVTGTVVDVCGVGVASTQTGVIDLRGARCGNNCLLRGRYDV